MPTDVYTTAACLPMADVIADRIARLHKNELSGEREIQFLVVQFSPEPELVSAIHVYVSIWKVACIHQEKQYHYDHSKQVHTGIVSEVEWAKDKQEDTSSNK